MIRIILSKKAMNAGALLFLTVAILLAVFIGFSYTRFGKYEQEIGENQAALLESKYNLEKKAFFLEQIAKNALIKSINEQGNKGGLYDLKCGDFLGYALWQSETDKCFLEKEGVMKNLQSYTKDNFDKIIVKTGFNSYSKSFNFFLNKEQNEFIGTAFKPMNEHIINKNSKTSLLPSFIAPFNYNIFSYDEFLDVFMGSNLINKVIECENKGKEILDCVRELVPTLKLNSDFNWEIDCDNNVKDDSVIKKSRIVPFCIIDKSEKILVYSKGSLLFDYPVLKFALYIADNPPNAITDLEIINPMGKDNYLLLKWSEIKEPDMAFYNIYSSSDFDLDSDLIKKLKVNDKVENISIHINDTENTDKNFGECIFEKKSGNTYECKPLIEQMVDSKLYLRDNSYYYLVRAFEMEKEYQFGVTGQDLGRNEIIRFEKDNIRKAKSKDNLAPGKVIFTLNYNNVENQVDIHLENVSRNIDGSVFSNDLKEYIYFMGNNKDNLVNYSNLQSITFNETRSIATIQKSFPSGLYYGGVIAIDDSYNPLRKVAATADREGYLEIKPGYSQIINDLANPQRITVP